MPETISGGGGADDTEDHRDGADYSARAPSRPAGPSDWVPLDVVEETTDEADRLVPRRPATIRESAAAKASSAPPVTDKPGRATPKGGPAPRAAKPGRYTPPIPKEKRQSPPWFPFVLLGFLILGLAVIVLNYVNVLPGGTNDWYLIGGIAAIVAGLFMATFYH